MLELKSKKIDVCYFLLFLVTKVLTSDPQTHNRCDRTHCRGQYTLSPPSGPLDMVSIAKNKATVYVFPKRIQIGYLRRKRLTIYCYDGSTMDANTGCKETTRYLTPSVEEAREWNKRKLLCKTGHECSPDSNCWGDGSKYCLDDKAFIDRGPQQLKYSGSRWLMFPYHTCVSSWECRHYNTFVDTSLLQIPGKMLPTGFYTTKFNDQILIDDQLFSNGKIDSEGYLNYIVGPKPIPEEIVTKVACYASDQSNAFCVYEDQMKVQHTFQITDGNKGINMNLHIIVHDEIIFPSKGIISATNHSTKHQLTLEQMSYTNLHRAASLESLKSHLQVVSINQLQHLYNSAVLMSQVSSLKAVINKIVESQAHLDETLIARILGRQFGTNWLDRNHFEICPCKKDFISRGTNCDHGEHYKDGFITKVHSKTLCKSIDVENLTSISLFEDTSLDNLILKVSVLREASSDNSAWDKLAEVLNKDVSNDHDPNDVSGEGHSISSLDYTTVISGIKNIFIWITITISWVSFFILFKRIDSK